MFDYREYIGNGFPSIIFSHVGKLGVHDQVPVKNEFFNRIMWSYPLFKELWIIDNRPLSQISDKFNSNAIQFYSIVKFCYLISVRLWGVRIDYVDKFLNQTKTHLPRLTQDQTNLNRYAFPGRRFRLPDPTGKYQKSLENGSSIPAGNFLDFFQ